jgi:hypothetical protein
MKRIVLSAIMAATLVADTNNVPSTAVVVSTETVTKIVAREPRLVVFVFNRDTGDVMAEVTYETVTRVDGQVAKQDPFKTVSMTWTQITNAVPSMTAALVEFRAAAAASMTNSP